MKQLTLVLVFCLPVVLFGQDTLSKWSWGAQLGAQRCYRRISSTADGIDMWNQLERAVVRPCGGLYLNYRLNMKLQGYVGASFSDRGYKIDSLSSASLNNLVYHIAYAELPLGLNYTRSWSKKNSLLAGVGLSFGYAIINRLDFFKDGQTAQFDINAIPGLDRVSLNVSASLGVRQCITETASVDVYLNGNQALLSLADGDYSRKLNSVGIFLAISNNF